MRVVSGPTETAHPQTDEQTRTRRVPPYHVILLNDDDHSFEFVVQVLRDVFGYPPEKAHQLTLEAHQSGRSAVWTGPREVAELKVDQIGTFHERRERDGTNLGPLGCRIEPAPGA